jgi:hypothetical protein
MLPRGLITVVLAIQVIEAGGSEVAFLPGLAFAVILVTNLTVVVGSFRAPRPVAASAVDSSALPSIVAVAETPPPRGPIVPGFSTQPCSLLLAICGFIVWYSKLPMDSRFLGLREWVKVHMLH